MRDFVRGCFEVISFIVIVISIYIILVIGFAVNL